MTPGPAGGLYVLISAEHGSVVALLDTTGKPQPGWPVALDDTFCSLPAAAADGSIRVVCAFDDAPVNRAYAFEPTGRSMAGWPVELPSTAATRVVDGDLYVMTSVVDALEVVSGLRLMAVAPDGTIRTGTPFQTPDIGQQDWNQQLGPDGTGYLLAYPTMTNGDTEITAFDLRGAREGWVVRVKGWPSGLAFGLDGRIYVTETAGVRTSRIITFDRDGRVQPFGIDAFPVAATSTYSGAGPFGGPPPPIVAKDGTAFLISEDGGTTVYSVDAAGQVMAGWPYRDTIGLRWSSDCLRDAGSPCWRSDSAVGAGDVLHLLHPPRAETLGGSVVAIGPDGRVRPGWPVELKRPGAEFWSVVVGTDGTAFALAIEPESASTSSASILAIAPDSTVLYTTTIVEP